MRNKDVVLSFYVKDSVGRSVKLLDITGPAGMLMDRGLRSRFAMDLGLRGWNHVACGKVRMYSDEGPGMGASDIHSVMLDEGSKRLKVIVKAGLAEKVEGGIVELPYKRGYETVWSVQGESMGVAKSETVTVDVEAEEAESMSEGSLVEAEYDKDSLAKMTKKGLYELADVGGLDYKKSWKKSELIDFIIKSL